MYRFFNLGVIGIHEKGNGGTSKASGDNEWLEEEDEIGSVGKDRVRRRGRVVVSYHYSVCKIQRDWTCGNNSKNNCNIYRFMFD